MSFTWSYKFALFKKSLTSPFSLATTQLFRNALENSNHASFKSSGGLSCASGRSVASMENLMEDWHSLPGLFRERCDTGPSYSSNDSAMQYFQQKYADIKPHQLMLDVPSEHQPQSLAMPHIPSGAHQQYGNEHHTILYGVPQPDRQYGMPQPEPDPLDLDMMSLKSFTDDEDDDPWEESNDLNEYEHQGGNNYSNYLGVGGSATMVPTLFGNQ